MLSSDEDLIIGIDTMLTMKCSDLDPILSLNMIDADFIRRKKPSNNSYKSFIFNNHGYLSGIAYNKSWLNRLDLNKLFNLKNNDYVHVLIFFLLFDINATFRYLSYPIVYKEVVQFEDDFLSKRKSWFDLNGRIEQALIYKDLAVQVIKPELKHILLDYVSDHIVDGMYSELNYSTIIKSHLKYFKNEHISIKLYIKFLRYSLKDLSILKAKKLVNSIKNILHD